jgi:predicted metal-dependent hydrolase
MLGLFQLDLPLFRSSVGTAMGNVANVVLGQSPGLPKGPIPEEPRTLPLGGREVRYSVKRSAKRRTLGLSIDTRGLRVMAPLRAHQADIDRLIHANARWVLTKLKEWEAPQHAGSRQWKVGEPLLFFGTRRPMFVAEGKRGLAKFDDRFILTAPKANDETQARETAVRAALSECLREEARLYFAVRLAAYAQAYGVQTPELRLSSAATRWGSCARAPDGSARVSLNWRMIHFAPRLIDYVIAHEVAHIKHMNHGKRFWAAVGKLYPDYEAARDEIKKRALELPEI